MNLLKRLPLLLLGCSTVGAAAAPAQTRCDPAQTGLTIYGAAARSHHFDAAELRALAPVTITAADHDAHEALFEGVPLSVLLQRAGVPARAALRGRANQLYLRIEARDGYAAVLALAETDSSFRARVPIVAWRKNGMPLDSATGPLQLVVPEDRVEDPLRGS